MVRPGRWILIFFITAFFNFYFIRASLGSYNQTSTSFSFIFFISFRIACWLSLVLDIESLDDWFTGGINYWFTRVVILCPVWLLPSRLLRLTPRGISFVLLMLTFHRFGFLSIVMWDSVIKRVSSIHMIIILILCWD